MSANFEPVTHAKASMAYVVPGILELPLLILPYWIASLTFMVFPFGDDYEYAQKWRLPAHVLLPNVRAPRIRSGMALIAAILLASTRSLGALRTHAAINRSNVATFPLSACWSILFKAFVSVLLSVMVLILFVIETINHISNSCGVRFVPNL